jgi:hypothetical protein
LQDKGYSDCSLRIKAKRSGKEGAIFAETISGEDFDKLVEAETERGNPRAIALTMSSWKQHRVGRSRLAFALKERTQEEKLEDFQASYDSYLANKEDWAEIEEQEQFLQTRPRAIADSWANRFYIPTASGYDTDPDCYQIYLVNTIN